MKAEATVTGALQAGSEGMGIGEEISGVSDSFDGLIDEVRISTTVRSDAWLNATWRNLSAPATFLSAGTEETEGGGGSPAPAGHRHDPRLRFLVSLRTAPAPALRTRSAEH